MFQVKCPECNEVREVKAKKPWMTGEQPYSKICKACCQLGKEKSAETLQKLSEATLAQQTPEVLAAKSQYMKDHPEVWQANLVAGAGGGWNKGETLPPRSEETKKKIGKGVHKAKSKK